MTATRQDISVEQGVTFDYVVDLLDEAGTARTDLAGYDGLMQIRAEQDDTSLLLGTATVSIDTINAQATATIADTVTDTYTWTAGWYDLRITNDVRSERVAQGRAVFNRKVTD